MNVLSLFDGISCGLVALKRNQIPIAKYYACEIDKNAIKVSKINHPEIIHLGNVCELKTIPEIDLLIGGSPCTDLSIANKNREGLKGNQSKLFWEYVRILKESNPKYFILENVNSMTKENKKIITDTLGVEPVMIDASLVSAQTRKRLFWTNLPVLGLPIDRKIYIQDVLESVKDFVIIGREIGRHLNDEGKREDKPEIPITRRIEIRKDNKSGTLTCVAKDNLVVGCSLRGRLEDDKWVNKIELRKDQKVSALTSAVSSKLALILNKDHIRRLTPIECERLQGLPDNYTSMIANSQRYKCLGNAFNVDVICFILEHIR